MKKVEFYFYVYCFLWDKNVHEMSNPTFRHITKNIKKCSLLQISRKKEILDV